MPVPVFSEDDLFHPDDVTKMPDNPMHRSAIEAIACASMALLGGEVEIFRDMNWYPSDGGNAVAPDVMVLPAGTLASSPDPRPRSYRQFQLGGPVPSVVVEVPSNSDTWASMQAKVRRYERLGTTAYVVTIDPPGEVWRYEPDNSGGVAFLGVPLPELGGLVLSFEDDRLVVTLPDGTRGADPADLVEVFANRAAALTEQLRRHGIEPEQ